MTRNNSTTRRSTKGLEKDKKKEKSKEKKGIECIQVIDNGDLDNDVNKQSARKRKADKVENFPTQGAAEKSKGKKKKGM